MKNQVNNHSSIVISIVAVIAVIIALTILLLGESILLTLSAIYPNWAFPAYFIPWFLLIISSIQKLNKDKKEFGLQVWVIKITIPLFIFTLPFFSQYLSNASIDCIDECIGSEAFFGFEPYCMFFAMISLFLLFLLPHKYLHNK